MRFPIWVFIFGALTFGPNFNSKEMKSNKITVDDLQDAKAVAAKFDTQLQQRKDITPIINEMFVADFLGELRRDPEEFPLAAFRPNVVSRVKRNDLLQYYILTMNSYHLNSLYLASKIDFSTTARSDLSPERMYPNDLLTLLKSNPAIAEQMNTPDGKIKSLKQLRRMLPTLRRAVELMRAYLKKHPPDGELYKRNVSLLNSRGDTLQPWETFCDEECYGFPKGTRLIRINTAFFQLLLVREENELRILSASPNNE